MRCDLDYIRLNVNNLKEENPFWDIFLSWDTQKNMNLLIWSKIMTFVFFIKAFRSSHQTCSIKKTVLKNFAIFTEKHPCWSLFQHRCFPVNIAKFLRSLILENIRDLGTHGRRVGRGGRDISCAQPAVLSALLFLHTRKTFLMKLLYSFWNNYRWISSINGYSNVINKSKNMKPFEFCVKALYHECCEIAKNL